MPDAPDPGTKFLLDPYIDWAGGEGVPIVEDFAVDMLTMDTAPWKRLGVDGALVHLKGRGDFVAVQLIDIAPGAKSAPLRHLYDEVFYVLTGHGSTRIGVPGGESHGFEWGPRSVFAPPLNAPFQLFNGSGRSPARLASANNLPMIMNLVHSEAFIFENPWEFRDRAGKDAYFAGDGDLLRLKPGSHMWETNFIPDLASLALEPWEARGEGSKNLKLILADSVMHAHSSEMAVGTYKKGHRHGPGAHVFAVTGEGFSLLWYQGDGEFVRHGWRHGVVFAPPDRMFHQHFNVSDRPARYLAVSLGSHRYPVTALKRARKQTPEASVKDGGWQIDYDDQDPRIHRMFLEELAKRGVASKMGKYFDEEKILEQAVGQPRRAKRSALRG